ncbi:MAG: CoA transferase [Chloroflexi bacterium]|nr:CoA transferase [Chloroflexota bacterium]
MPRLALEGLRIADLTQVFAGPYATKLLADMGAEVIKIESCVRCDRPHGPVAPGTGMFPDDKPGDEPYNRGAYYNELNRSKYAITLDLTHATGKEVFNKLVKVSDAVVENYSARVMKNFGLDYGTLRAIKPDLVMVSMPGYGMSGPYRDYVTYGTGTEAMALCSDLTGYADGAPLKPGIAYGDPTGGMFAAFALLAAIRYRNKTGRGQYVDLSLRESLIQMFGDAVMDYTMNGRVQRREGNRHPSMAPHGCYRCKGEDNWVAIAVSDDQEWQAFCRAMDKPGLAQDNRFTGASSRWRHGDDLDQLVDEWTRRHDNDEVMHILQEAGVPAAAVLNIRQILANPHFVSRGYFENVFHSATGTYPYPGVAWKLSKTAGSIHRPPPLFAEHNDFVLGEILGLSREERDALRREGVIGDEPL